MDFDDYIENQRLKTDLQEQKVIFYCDNCQAEIYKGNEFYCIEGYNLCEDCYDEIQRKEKEDCKCIAGEDYD